MDSSFGSRVLTHTPLGLRELVRFVVVARLAHRGLRESAPFRSSSDIGAAELEGSATLDSTREGEYRCAVSDILPKCSKLPPCWLEVQTCPRLNKPFLTTQVKESFQPGF